MEQVTDVEKFITNFSHKSLVNFLTEFGLDPNSGEENDVNMRIVLTKFGTYLLADVMQAVSQEQLES